MRFQNVVAIIAIATVLLVWVLNLVRRGKLYVGYGAFLVVGILAVIVTLSIPPLLAIVTRLVGALLPESALILITFSLIAFMFVYVLTQLTIISNRVATLVQELAIQQTKHEPQGPSVPLETHGSPR